MNDELTDPFADEEVTPLPPPNISQKERIKKTMKAAEKDIEIANSAPLPFVDESKPEAIQRTETGSLEVYTRVGDLAPSTGMFKLEEIEGRDIVILGGVKREGDYGAYLSLDFEFKNPDENPDPERGATPYIVNVGGTVAVPKIVAAMKKINDGKAQGPLVAAFVQRPMSNSQSFWDVY